MKTCRVAEVELHITIVLDVNARERDLQWPEQLEARHYVQYVTWFARLRESTVLANEYCVHVELKPPVQR